MNTKVLVVGDVMTDIIVRPEGPLVLGSDRRARIESKPGGSGANQAVWLGASGVAVKFAARVGAAQKREHEARFLRQGVTPVLVGDPMLASGTLVTLVDPNGERSFLTDRGANLNLSAEDLGDHLLDGVGLVVISGYSFFAPGPRAAVQSLIERARARDVALAIDPASTGFLAEVGPRNFLDWVGTADWLFANESEAQLLTGEADSERQMRQLGEQFGQVVIKRGALGASCGGAAGIAISRPAPQVRVVDSTGAGDAFAAGFIAGLMGKADLETCLERGVANGARAVQHVGGQPQGETAVISP
ncbi:Sugar or nucleoside kinase, ribokinase family [Devosia crocina]|uniref:Sugar or nucleoside kinase, ribokinase family n=1 Tax=Devosia crocina TaxID=429728 RepID=A0A1I7NR58_9HYPH|nr:sugar kinase [Devosia crocina]SFV37181.1 Sugar or nucleoside kinase, ribokinase family [Devosia crocina]